jgi:hypothetical protein
MEPIKCNYCGIDPGTKEDSIVWLGFIDKDTGDHVCFNCQQKHYALKFTTREFSGLYSEFPVTIK